MKNTLSNNPFACTAAPLENLNANQELLQTAFWGEFKAHFGWKPFCLKVEYGRETQFLLVLYREPGLGMGIAYVPYPAVSRPGTEAESSLANLARAMAPLLPPRTRFIRFDLAWHTTGAGNLPVPLETNRGLYKAPMDIQPPSTVLLDLQQSEEELLTGMKQKTRYNVRLAEKKGVEITEGSERQGENLETWYEMYRETAARDKIVLHSFDYYKQLFAAAGKPGTGKLSLHLLFARINNEPVAGIVVALNGKQATYLYGASNNLKRNYMPNYLLQWQAIRMAKQAGCTSYDFFGIPEENNPEHPMYGLYRFKTGFGGTIVNRYGCYDFALSHLYYTGYRCAETARKFYYKRLRKALA